MFRRWAFSWVGQLPLQQPVPWWDHLFSEIKSVFKDPLVEIWHFRSVISFSIVRMNNSIAVFTFLSNLCIIRIDVSVWWWQVSKKAFCWDWQMFLCGTSVLKILLVLKLLLQCWEVLTNLVWNKMICRYQVWAACTRITMRPPNLLQLIKHQC